MYSVIATKNMADSWQLKHAHAQITIQYNRGANLVYVKWSGHLAPEDLLSTANAYLELQEEWRCPRILNDKLEVTGDWNEANDWLEYEWLPKAVSLGLTQFAMLIPYDFEQIVAANELLNRFSGSCNTRLFWDAELAEAWISDGE